MHVVWQDSFRALYQEGQLDERKITIDIPGSRVNVTNMDGPGGQALQVINFSNRRLPMYYMLE